MCEDRELIAALDAAATYREFLAEAFRILKARDPRFGFAAFARKAGFSARSLPRDVLAGKKITRKTLPGFARALGLKGSSARYFAALVYREHPEESPGQASPSALNARLERLKQRRNQVATGSSSVYRQLEWPEVFASLGNPETGATLEEVSRRAGIAIPDCERILSGMREAELVAVDPATRRYRAHNAHLFFEKLGGNSEFRGYFGHLMTQLNRSAQSRFEREDALYFASTVSIRKERAGEFKDRLRELLSEFVLDIDQAQGDGVAHLACAFQPK